MAQSLMETSDGRPSALAHSLSAPKGGDAEATIPERTAAEAIAINGASGRLMTKEERKKLEAAIEKSESLEGECPCVRCSRSKCALLTNHRSMMSPPSSLAEIRRLEERLRLGYAIEDPAASSGSKKRKKSAEAETKRRGQGQAEEEEEEEEDE